MRKKRRGLKKNVNKNDTYKNNQNGKGEISCRYNEEAVFRKIDTHLAYPEEQD